jgi:hypothetical protein
MNALATIESRFRVLEWRADGIDIWPLVRIRWFMRQWAIDYGSAGRSEGRFSRLFNRATSLINAPLRASRAQRASAATRPDEACEVLLFSDGVSYSQLDRWSVDRFCDPLFKALQNRGALARIWTPLHAYRQDRLVPSTYVQPRIDRANLLGAVRARAGSANLPEHARVIDWLRTHQLHTESAGIGRIVSDAYRVASLSKMFCKLLEAARPRMAFVVSYYSIETMAFVLACRRLHIATVEIQHGVQGALHAAYAAWPRPAGSVHELLPDRFWVWSEWEQQVIDAWAHGTEHRAIVGGNPWMDVWTQPHDWPMTQSSQARASTMRLRAHGRAVVLVTLQYGFMNEEQISPLMELVRARPDGLMFWIRLHPLMLGRREEIRQLLPADGCFELDEPTDLPLQSLLTCTDVHMTHSSSVVIEAAQFGVKSVITSRFGEELFEPLYRSGWVQTEEGRPDVLAATLQGSARKRHETGSPGVASRTQSALDVLLGNDPSEKLA